MWIKLICKWMSLLLSLSLSVSLSLCLSLTHTHTHTHTFELKGKKRKETQVKTPVYFYDLRQVSLSSSAYTAHSHSVVLKSLTLWFSWRLVAHLSFYRILVSYCLQTCELEERSYSHNLTGSCAFLVHNYPIKFKLWKAGTFLSNQIQGFQGLTHYRVWWAGTVFKVTGDFLFPVLWFPYLWSQSLAIDLVLRWAIKLMRINGLHNLEDVQRLRVLVVVIGF